MHRKRPQVLGADLNRSELSRQPASRRQLFAIVLPAAPPRSRVLGLRRSSGRSL